MNPKNDRAPGVASGGDGVRHDIGQDRLDEKSVPRAPVHRQILIKGRRASQIPPLKRRKEWRELPYGKWTCANGTVVLFNRGYKPIWSRSPGTAVLAMLGDEWIENIVREEWFYDDSNPPWRDSGSRRRCEQILRDFFS